MFDKIFGYLDSLRPIDRLIYAALLAVFLVAAVWNVYTLSKSYLINVPVAGGVLIEGAIGSPRFINPVLAITRADNDLTALTYSGLLRLSPDGTLVNDLAESITVSDDGRVYNVLLKQDRYFHDGTRVKAEDVAFTIGLIQKPSVKSPLYGNWNGVVVELIDTYELNLVLDTPYSPFVENLTIGILPKHIWSTLSEEELPFSQRNIEPIGSGPYQVERVARNSAGLISEYELRGVSDQKESTNIERIIIRFYQNEEAIITALQKGEINSTSYLSDRSLSSLKDGPFTFISEPLPRVFSVFFNQNKNPALRDPSARAALEVLIDRDEIVAEVVNGYGRPAYSPIPPEWLETEEATTVRRSKEERLVAAREILESNGWTQSTNGRWIKTIDGVDTPFLFTIRSANDSLFEKIASNLTSSWQELGIEPTFEFYEQSDLVQTVIRPRDYQALLFGIDLGRSLDFYPFWHSGSREDPGLNVSLYANITVDRLVGDLRLSTSTEDKHRLMEQFVAEIDKDKPAIFIFAPSFEYVVRSNISAAEMNRIQKPSERFSNITNWHMNESGVWPFFKNQ
ncbi:MAG: ABC transporter substrate-binding protein [Candidatus Paceibacterota bacterium]